MVSRLTALIQPGGAASSWIEFGTNDTVMPAGVSRAECLRIRAVPQVLEFGHGVQIRVAQGWAHTNGNPQQFRLTTEDDPMLTPGSERLVSVVRPSFGVPWRVVAVCWEPGSQTMPKGKEGQFHSPEIGR